MYRTRHVDDVYINVLCTGQDMLMMCALMKVLTVGMLTVALRYGEKTHMMMTIMTVVIPDGHHDCNSKDHY